MTRLCFLETRHGEVMSPNIMLGCLLITRSHIHTYSYLHNIYVLFFCFECIELIEGKVSHMGERDYKKIPNKYLV